MECNMENCGYVDKFDNLNRAVKLFFDQCGYDGWKNNNQGIIAKAVRENEEGMFIEDFHLGTFTFSRLHKAFLEANKS